MLRGIVNFKKFHSILTSQRHCTRHLLSRIICRLKNTHRIWTLGRYIKFNWKYQQLMESCTVVLTFESVDEILWCYHSNETSSAVLSHGTIYLVSSSDFWVCGWNLVMLPFKWNLFSSTVTWCFLILYVVLTFKSGWNPILLPFKWNLVSSTFTWHYLLFSTLQKGNWKVF